MNRRSPASIGNPAPTGATCAYTGATGYRTSIRSWPTRSVLRNWLLSLILMRLICEYPLVCAFDKQHCNRARQAGLDGRNREWTAGPAVVGESTAQPGTVAEEFYGANKAIPILPQQAFERVIFVSPV